MLRRSAVTRYLHSASTSLRSLSGIERNETDDGFFRLECVGTAAPDGRRLTAVAEAALIGVADADATASSRFKIGRLPTELSPDAEAEAVLLDLSIAAAPPLLLLAVLLAAIGSVLDPDAVEAAAAEAESEDRSLLNAGAIPTPLNPVSVGEGDLFLRFKCDWGFSGCAMSPFLSLPAGAGSELAECELEIIAASCCCCCWSPLIIPRKALYDVALTGGDSEPETTLGLFSPPATLLVPPAEAANGEAADTDPGSGVSNPPRITTGEVEADPEPALRLPFSGVMRLASIPVDVSGLEGDDRLLLEPAPARAGLTANRDAAFVARVSACTRYLSALSSRSARS